MNIMQFTRNRYATALNPLNIKRNATKNAMKIQNNME